MRILLTLCSLHFAAWLSDAAFSHLENATSVSYPSSKNYTERRVQVINDNLLFHHEALQALKNDNANEHASRIKNRPWDIENENTDSALLLVTASSGSEKIKDKISYERKSVEKNKTLSDQVAEGKYGLIHRELFQTTPQRLGVLSYKTNLDVPKDNKENYGGLHDEEIWLAEDYLLVLKGGYVNKKSNNNTLWKPIDDYAAPARQVKIPLYPKVPPPFPVQLTDNGPIQFIGNNKILHSEDSVPNIQKSNVHKKNHSSFIDRNTTLLPFNGYQYPPPVLYHYNTLNNTFKNSIMDVRPFSEAANITQIDEEDQSLYYPPPYSFEYKINYSNPVPPGPLVPGIILPPPPNFFAPLENDNDTTKKKPLHQRINNTEPSSAKKTPIKAELNFKAKPITIETPNYKIEIEKIDVKKFAENNDDHKTNKMYLINKLNQQSKSNFGPKPLLGSTTKYANDNNPISRPLISLNSNNFKGNPIYFEYFEAKTPAIQSLHDHSTTTPVPYISSLIKQRYNTIKNKTSDMFNTLPLNAHNLNNYQYMHQFHKEIETIKQTLKLYDKTTSLNSNNRSPKEQPFPYEFKKNIAPVLESSSSLLRSNPSSSLTFHKLTAEKKLPTHYYNQHLLRNYLAKLSPAQQNVNKNNQMYNQLPNVGITTPFPFDYVSYTSTKPFFLEHLNWYSVGKGHNHEDPRPLIYNNGASGYNSRLGQPDKLRYGTPVFINPNLNQPSKHAYQPSYKPSFDLRHKFHPRYQQGVFQSHLDSDILINYKNPLPVINPQSELLPERKNVLFFLAN